MSEFPIFKTKRANVSEKFDLNDPVGRHKYFEAKAGPKIERLKEYLDRNTFVAFMLAKKGAGKGTYAKMFAEVIGSERVTHISVGDIVREVHQSIDEDARGKELKAKLQQTYRGFIPFEEAVEALLGRSTKKLIPTEFILSLIKLKIAEIGQKAVFIDGFPRSLDQVSYSLFFREIMNLRPDPDFFVLIDIPETIIDARLKGRVVCPICQTSRNLTLLPTKFVAYDEANQRFVIKCDNAECSGFGKEILVTKEGDALGIEAIRDRLETDGQLIKSATALQGIPKIYLRNDIPVAVASDYIDDYEITPEYSYERDQKTGEVKIIEKPWVTKSDDGTDSYSHLAPPVVLSLIEQVHDLLLR